MTKTMVTLCALVALLPSAARAQGFGPARAVSGITVTGRGSTVVHVQKVWFTAQVRGSASESDVRATLQSAGVTDVTVGPDQPRIYQNAPTSVRGLVSTDLAPAKIAQLGALVVTFVKNHPGTALDSVGFTPVIDGCEAVEGSSRRRALLDAHRKAAAIAEASGAALGGVVGVDEIGGCPGDPAPYLNNSSPVPFDLGALTATITVTETVTYGFAARAAMK
ncbi:MAG: SIMPL domain-containing protein [Vulcanimicrobiaceae bacterium]|jgi:hypothetical protein